MLKQLPVRFCAGGFRSLAAVYTAKLLLNRYLGSTATVTLLMWLESGRLVL